MNLQQIDHEIREDEQRVRDLMRLHRFSRIEALDYIDFCLASGNPPAPTTEPRNEAPSATL